MVNSKMPTDESTENTLHGCLREWDYVIGESEQFGWETKASLPCQLRFTEDPIQDTERFHEELEARGIAPLDSDADRRAGEGKVHYEGEVMLREDYHRIKVLVFRGGVARLYPLDENVPRRGQLARLVEALEIAFGAHLEHDPIDKEGNDGWR